MLDPFATLGAPRRFDLDLAQLEKTLMRQGFKFVNPNEKASCGCGTSFTV